jgi:hypothetical protein
MSDRKRDRPTRSLGATRAGRRIAGILAVAVAVPAVALAAPHPPPSAGKWKLLQGTAPLVIGGFTISHNGKSISNIHLTPVQDPSCGTGEITFAGAHKLHRIPTKGAYPSWILGTTKGRVLVPAKLTAHQAGRTFTAHLYLVFAIGGVKKDNGGQLDFGRGACVMQLTSKK